MGGTEPLEGRWKSADCHDHGGGRQAERKGSVCAGADGRLYPFGERGSYTAISAVV